MYCDSICAFIFNFTGSKGPYGDCLKLLCHFVCRSFSSLCLCLGFIFAPYCLHTDAVAIYFELWIFSFTRMIKRLAVARVCVVKKLVTVQQGLISIVNCTVNVFSWAIWVNTGRRALRFIYSTITLSVEAQSINNQVKEKSLGVCTSVEWKDFKLRLHTLVHTLHNNTTDF